MKKIVLKADRRDVVGKKVKVLRREGKLPAIIYGKGVEPLPIIMELKETAKQLREATQSSVLTIEVAGGPFTVLMRDRQYGILSHELEHIDFLAVSMTELVRTQVNITLEGEAPAIELFGAMLITGLDSIEVEALPGNLVDEILVDVSGLKEIGDSILVKDLVMPEGVECLEDPEEMIVVATAQQIEEIGEEGEDLEVEPEVIEKGKREEDED